MKAKWHPTGWAASDAGGERIEYSLYLPGYGRAVIARTAEYPSEESFSPKLGAWFWWIGSDRAHRPDKWPGNGPYKTQAKAKAACVEALRGDLALALEMLAL